MTTTQHGTGRQEQRRTESREAILASARALLATEGYQALAIREIAQRAGCAVGTVYLHFEDKADLVRQLLQEDFAAMAGRIHSVRAADPVERLRRIAKAYLAFARESPERYRLLFLTPGLPDPQERPERQRVQRGDPELDGYRVLFNAVRDALIVRGTDPIDIEVNDATQLLWAGLHGVASVRSGLNARWVPWRPDRHREARMLDVMLAGALSPITSP